MRSVASGFSQPAHHCRGPEYKRRNFLLGLVPNSFDANGSQRGSAGRSHSETERSGKRSRGVNRRRILLFVLFLITAGEAAGQQASQTAASDERSQPSNGSAPVKPAQRPPRQAGDIVTDNLDRVAATAQQLIETLNRDAGLMVELKRAIAQDAGENGQLLEETDLTDAAIADRLWHDLHIRVIATRLVQRYGYLLPKVNPDSDLAAEHNLQMRARAQELEHAAQSQDGNRAAPQTVITVGAPSPTETSLSRARPVRLPPGAMDGVG